MINPQETIPATPGADLYPIIEKYNYRRQSGLTFTIQLTNTEVSHPRLFLARQRTHSAANSSTKHFSNFAPIPERRHTCAQSGSAQAQDSVDISRFLTVHMNFTPSSTIHQGFLLLFFFLNKVSLPPKTALKIYIYIYFPGRCSVFRQNLSIHIYLYVDISYRYS